MTKNNEFYGFIQRNANIITIFAVVAVILVGGSLASGSQTWLYSLGLVSVVGGISLVFFNFKSAIKGAIAIFVLLYAMSTMIKFSIILSDDNLLAYSSLQQLCLFLGLLLYSYFTYGIRSRWTAVGLATLVNFSIILSYPTKIGFASGAAVGFIVFAAYYKYLRNPLLGDSKFPQLVNSDEIDAKIHKVALLENWNVQKRTKGLFKKNKSSDYLIWNENNAFLLVPIKMNSAFVSVEGRRGAKLAYEGNTVNRWLLRLTGARVPIWSVRYAPVMAILLDVDNTNGSEPQTIGVGIPDSRLPLPIGIYPAKKMLNSSGNVHTFSHIVEKYGTFVRELTPRQYKSLNSLIGQSAGNYIKNENETKGSTK